MRVVSIYLDDNFDLSWHALNERPEVLKSPNT